MVHHVMTFTDYLLEEEAKHPHARGGLTLLLVQMESAAKIIAAHVRESGLIDILGKTGKTNSFQEEVQKLDELSNNILIEMLSASRQTYALVSEEVENPIITPINQSGDYIVYFDPLDGSSNIDVNAPIGTIFSIYHKKDGLLQKGKQQIACGYIIYGSSVMLVFTTGRNVVGFTLDPSIGSFLLSHLNIAIPQSGTTYSVNEAYSNRYDDSLKKYLEKVKEKPKTSLRYIGSLIADVHRTLLKGGIFLYPADTQHPQGKLRLMLEVNPMALLVQVAGGKATVGTKNPLDILPQSIHDTSPLILGSTKNVVEYESYL